MNSVETGLPEAALIAYTRDLIERPLTWATRERLAQALLDWLTAGWSALDLPAAPRLRDLAATLHPGTGPAPVFGGPPLTPMAAAWANAGISHLREIDDAHRDAMLHPGVVVLPPVLALAAAHGLTQRQVAQAVIAGYEIVLRLGESMGAGHAGRFHATATVGSVGAPPPLPRWRSGWILAPFTMRWASRPRRRRACGSLRTMAPTTPRRCTLPLPSATG